MARFIQATNGIHILPGPHSPTEQHLSWETCVKTLFNDLRLQKMLPIFDLIDLRKKVLGCEVGRSVPITDDEAKALEEICRRCEIFLPFVLYSPGAEEFLRAFTDAPTKEPSSRT